MGIWDGLFQIDWLEKTMLLKENKFCEFRQIKSLVCSWNIDSSKPAELFNSNRSASFLKDVLTSSFDAASASTSPPEIIAFSLQEVIDLENKKLTASESGAALLGTETDALV